MPDAYGYKTLCFEFTKFRMKQVDENLSVRAIEEKISAGLVEELIYQAHNEIKLLRIMKNWKPWEYLQSDDYEGKEQLNAMLNFTGGDPMAQTYERYDNMKHTAGPRKPSAGLHPEDKN